MRRLLLLVLGLLPAVAGAYESEPVEMVFTDDFEVFPTFNWDTGWYPSSYPSSGYLGVRFYIESHGDVDMGLGAESELSWPESLTHELSGIFGTGWLSVIAGYDIAAQVGYNISISSYTLTGTYDIWDTTFIIEDGTTFTPLLLGETATVEADGAGLTPFSESISPVSLISIEFDVEIFPRAYAAMTGINIETNSLLMQEESETLQFDIPIDDPSQLELASTYKYALDADLGIVIQPSVEVCADIPVIGEYCYEIASYDFEIDLAGVDEEYTLPTVEYSHPLPALVQPVDSHDFEKVTLGNLSNLLIPIEDAGLLTLLGYASIEGSEAFSVYPEVFYATEDLEDGIVVTFEPFQVGQETATLVLDSNDPQSPILEIPLFGYGEARNASDNDDGTGGSMETVRSCGCTAGSVAGSLTPLWSLLPLLALFRRRTRS